MYKTVPTSSSSSSKAFSNDTSSNSNRILAKFKLPSKRRKNSCRPNVPEVYPIEAQQLSHLSSSSRIIPKETDPSLLSSADHRSYFAEARSTPIIYSTQSSTSSLGDYIQTKNRADSLCSARSFSVAQQSTHSSTQNQTFHFGTPLSPQTHQPYQYHDTSQQQRLPPLMERKKGMFLQSSTASMKTIRSWRQKRIHLIMKQQDLPEFETKAFCQDCEKYIQTRIRYKNGSMVWLVSFTLLLCTVILFWVPFYVKYFKDVAHFCPGCGKRLGVSYRL